MRRVLVAILVVVGTVLGAAQLLLFGVGHLHPQVSELVSGALGRKVSIGEIETEWRGWQLALKVRDVHLITDTGTRDGDAPGFDEAIVVIDTFASIGARQLLPSEIVIRGASLGIARSKDGIVRIEGLGPNQSPDQSMNELRIQLDVASWLRGGARLELGSTRIQWVDEGAGREPVVLEDVNVKIHQASRGPRIEATGGGSDAGQWRIAVDVSGTELSPRWAGSALVEADDIDLATAPAWWSGLGLPSGLSGRASAAVWSAWHEGRIEQVRGSFTLEDPRWAVSPHAQLSLASVKGEVRAAREEGAWQLHVERLRIRAGDEDWPVANVGLRLAPAAPGTPGELTGRIDSLRVERLLALLGRRQGHVPSSWADRVRGLNAAGTVHDLRFTFAPGRAVNPLELRAEVSALSLSPGGPMPAVEDVNGSLEWRGSSGLVRVAAGRLRAAASERWPTPWSVEDLAGDIRWHRDTGGLRLETPGLSLDDGNLRVRLTGGMDWRAEDSAPRIRLLAGVEADDITGLKRYLPARGLPERLAKWLREAPRAGRLTQGEVVIEGPLAEIPFDQGQGTLSARLHVTNGALEYAPGWPVIIDGDAELHFENRRAQFHISDGEITGGRVVNAHVEIPDMLAKPRRVIVKGQMRGSSRTGLRYLLESPLRARFQHFLKAVRAAGPSLLDLEVTVTLPKRMGETEVRGVLNLSDNVVDLPGLAVGLQHTNGVVRFDNIGITANDLRADYLGRPIRLDAEKWETRDGTRIQVVGEATREYLLRHLHNAGLLSEPTVLAAPIIERLHGITQWRAIVDVPHERRADQPVVRLEVRSRLEGARFDLPHPFAKTAEEASQLTVETRFLADKERHMEVHYGDQVRAMFQLTPEGDRYRLRRGVVGFGVDEPKLPDGAIVAVRGRVDELAAGEWYRLLRGAQVDDPPGPSPGAEPNGPRFVDRIQSINLAVAKLDLFGSPFENARVDIERKDDGTWMAAIIAPELLGEVAIPREVGTLGVTANFDKLEIPVREQPPVHDTARVPDPRELPPFRFNCKKCVYGDIPLGTVKVTARPSAEGINFDNVYVLNDGFEIRAHGRWTYDGHEHHSEFEAELHSGDVGRMLSGVGMEGATSGGAMDLLLDAGWPGAPMDFDLQAISGVLHFRASKGRLLELDPGTAGRMFGLFLLPSLPRRLSLDFSDLFDKGFSYTRLEGSFSIEGGDARTTNLHMDSPTARIDVTGRTGLVDEDYDQLIVVTPKVSSSLPLAPIWLAEKMLKRQTFDNAFSYRYAVTGSWDEPTVTRLEVPTPANRPPLDER